MGGDNLANWGHMLAVKPAAGAATVGDAVRQRFPEMKDAGLQDPFQASRQGAIEPTDKVHELDNKSGFAVEGFLAFDPDGRFARRVQRLDSQIVKRLVSRAAPESDPATVAKQVQQELSSVTVRDFILERIPAESKRTVDRTIREGLFVVPRTGLVQVEPDSPVEPGATYLLAERTVTVVEGFWEYSYAENPAGAFSMLLWLDAKLRLAIFLTFGIVAILALGYMIVRAFGKLVADGCPGCGARRRDRQLRRPRDAYVCRRFHPHVLARLSPGRNTTSPISASLAA